MNNVEIFLLSYHLATNPREVCFQVCTHYLVGNEPGRDPLNRGTESIYSGHHGKPISLRGTVDETPGCSAVRGTSLKEQKHGIGSTYLNLLLRESD